MALITREDVYLMLDQAHSTSEEDALLDTLIPQAEASIFTYLGYEWSGYATTATAVTVTGTGTAWLSLPPHQIGSITSLVVEGGTSEITGYIEQPDGDLYIGSSGVWGWSDSYSRAGWARGRRYTVTAKWGYGTAPEDLKRIAVEVVVNMRAEKSKNMISDVVGVDTGNGVAVGYTRAWTNRQQALLNIYRRRYARPMVA